MELEALKTIWLKTFDRQTETLSRDDIRRATEKKSTTVISKIRKRLQFKIWVQSLIGAFGTVLSIFLLLEREFAFGLTYLIIFPMVIGLGIHKYQHYRTIVAFQRSSLTLNETLHQIIEIMNKVIRAQILTSVLVGTLFAALFSYIGLTSFEDIALWQQISLVVAIAAGAPFIFYQIAKKGQQKMFGKYLLTLKEYRKELNTKDHNHEY